MVVLVVEAIAAQQLIAQKEQELLSKVLTADKVWAVKGSFGLAEAVVVLVVLAERQLLESVVMVALVKALQYLAFQSSTQVVAVGQPSAQVRDLEGQVVVEMAATVQPVPTQLDLEVVVVVLAMMPAYGHFRVEMEALESLSFATQPLQYFLQTLRTGPLLKMKPYL
jgi:hypothetical protein